MSHVLDKFKFCPVCGSPNFEINNIKSKKCTDCGFSYYLNPSSATVAFILNEKDELLVVRRKNERTFIPLIRKRPSLYPTIIN